MGIEEGLFERKRVILEKLIPFGFVQTEQGYVYRELILSGDFEVEVLLDKEGEVTGRVIDVDLEEEYTALHVVTAVGNFVGQVREAYLAVLSRIAETCFEAQPFISQQMNRLARRIAQEWGDSLDYPFEKYPVYSSYRIGGKWYALIFPLQWKKLGDFPKEIAEQTVEVVNLKVASTDMEELLGKEGLYPSYHMSKKSWISLVLNDSLSDDEVWDLLANSRKLANPNALARSEGPNYWILPANPKYYDIDAEFAAHSIVDWPQKASIRKGDFLAIYMTAPIRSLRYLCRVLEDGLEKSAEPKRMQLELVEKFEDEVFPIDRLKECGVTNIRGPRRMTKELITAIKEVTSDDSTDGGKR